MEHPQLALELVANASPIGYGLGLAIRNAAELFGESLG